MKISEQEARDMEAIIAAAEFHPRLPDREPGWYDANQLARQAGRSKADGDFRRKLSNAVAAGSLERREVIDRVRGVRLWVYRIPRPCPDSPE